jgi:hypothetical protein
MADKSLLRANDQFNEAVGGTAVTQRIVVYRNENEREDGP